MNFGAQLATNQKFNLRDAFRGLAGTPEELVSAALDRLTSQEYSAGSRAALADYVAAGAPWTGSDAQLATKGAGLVHLILGSAEYQLV